MTKTLAIIALILVALAAVSYGTRVAIEASFASCPEDSVWARQEVPGKFYCVPLDDLEYFYD